MAKAEQGAPAGAEITEVQFRLSEDHAEHKKGDVITVSPYLARKLQRKKLGAPVEEESPTGDSAGEGGRKGSRGAQ